MNRSQSTQGMTMVLVVLFMLLLLSGLLAASLRLGLGSRQNTADQAAALRAQYAAESSVSMVRSRLRDYQNILTTNVTDAGGNSVTNLQMPSGTVQQTVEDDAKAFCGQASVPNPFVSTNDFAAPREAGDADVFPLAVQCVATAAPTPASYGILADAVKPVAYNQLPASERPSSTASRSELLNWWANSLNNVTVGNVKYDIRPIRVVKLTARRYRFYLGATSVAVKGDAGGGTRYLKATRTTDGDWWFEITVPNPFENVLFINQWPSADGGFYNDTIDGDFFTNQKIRMLFGVNLAAFKGKVRSVGCTGFPSSSAPAGTDCTKADGAGFYGGLNTLIRPASAGAGVDAINANLKARMMAQGTTFTDTGTNAVTFTDSYVPLRLDSDIQEEAAAAGGLTLDDKESGVELVAGDSDGNPLTTYNAGTSSWTEPNPTYQYIRIKKQEDSGKYDTSTWLEIDKSTYDSWPGGHRTTAISLGKTYYYIRPKIVNNSREFRFGPDKILYEKKGNGWNSTGTTFNGVIYSASDANVTGPLRKDVSMTADVSKMPPALASFARVNVTAKKGITLDTDLTMSNTPCNNSNAQAGCPKSGNAEPVNALGLFAPDKDVVMSKFTQAEATYHAAIMASQGAFNVENYDKRRAQGSRHVTGSVVENRYGLNGVASLSGSTVTFTNGYGDDFSFDSRLKKDVIPSSPIVMVWQGADASNTQKRLANLTWKQATAGQY
jgi:type II secretory pathway pseudopilin PulG